MSQSAHGDRRALSRNPTFSVLLCLVSCLSGAPRGWAEEDGPAWLPAIETEEEFELVSVPSQIVGETDRITKYLIPLGDDPGLIPPLFQNVNDHEFQYMFNTPPLNEQDTLNLALKMDHAFDSGYQATAILAYNDLDEQLLSDGTSAACGGYTAVPNEASAACANSIVRRCSLCKMRRDNRFTPP